MATRQRINRSSLIYRRYAMNYTTADLLQETRFGGFFHA